MAKTGRKADPERRLTEYVKELDMAYTKRAGARYRLWNRQIKEHISDAGLKLANMHTVKYFSEIAQARIDMLRETQSMFQENMQKGYPMAALDTYFSDGAINILCEAAQAVGETIKPESLRGMERKLREESASAIMIRDAYVYEVDRILLKLARK